jgi:ABC-type proline/glycine betaine transport system permease subunit
MLGLLKQAWNYFTSGLATVYHWVLNAIAAVYSYVNKLFDSLSRYAINVYRELETFAHAVNVWVTKEVSWIIAFIKSEANAIVHWTLNIYDDLRSYAEAVYRWAVKYFDYVINWVTANLAKFIKWIVQDVWTPLYNYFQSLFAWIDKYGSWLWDVVSNPEKLVAWIARYLLSAWLTILKTWSGAIVKWIIQQSYRFLPDIVSLLEDIISKVL